jgi:hypothetical protein
MIAVDENALRRVRALAAEHGHDLGEALLLAAERTGQSIEHRRELVRLVARAVSGAVNRLRDANVAEPVIAAYAEACRGGIRGAVAGARAVRAPRWPRSYRLRPVLLGRTKGPCRDTSVRQLARLFMV